MNINKIKYYSTEKLEEILDELENGDGGRGMKDYILADIIRDIIAFREENEQKQNASTTTYSAIKEHNSVI